jgi:hypothetical protein
MLLPVVRDDFTRGEGISTRTALKRRSKVSNAHSSRIPLTPKQRLFLAMLLLLAVLLSNFVVSTIDPLATNLRLSRLF